MEKPDELTKKVEESKKRMEEMYRLMNPQYHVLRILEEIRESQKEEVSILRSLLEAVLALKP